MADNAPAPAKSPKKKAAAKPKKPAEHPKYIDMVLDAIKNLKERKGSSRQAILKYVMSKFKVGNDATKVNSRVKVALKNGVKSKVLKQSKGTGAQGRFSVGEKKAAVKKPKAAKPKTAKKPAAKKPKAAKKPAGEKAKKVKKSPKKAKAAKPKTAKPKTVKKSPKKATKAAKPKKAKTPKKAAKPKKTKTPKKAATKK
ncbi:histone H1-delta-like [Saccostrea cucullata]|uniref:histone H1-delta-like n=1 Tax=Saccostrea cuccullata TaxID=36930 RepID=UPI002ECFB909